MQEDAEPGPVMGLVLRVYCETLRWPQGGGRQEACEEGSSKCQPLRMLTREGRRTMAERGGLCRKTHRQRCAFQAEREEHRMPSVSIKGQAGTEIKAYGHI